MEKEEKRTKEDYFVFGHYHEVNSILPASCAGTAT